MALKKDIEYKVYDDLIDFGAVRNSSHHKHLKLLKWSGMKKSVWDIRKWNDDNGTFSKGISLTFDDMRLLKQTLNAIDLDIMEAADEKRSEEERKAEKKNFGERTVGICVKRPENKITIIRPEKKE